MSDTKEITEYYRALKEAEKRRSWEANVAPANNDMESDPFWQSSERTLKDMEQENADTHTQGRTGDSNRR